MIVFYPKRQMVTWKVFVSRYLFYTQKPPAGQNISDIIIEKALDNFSQKITPEMLQQAQAQGMNLYQIITLASIIERSQAETRTTEKLLPEFFTTV